MSEVLQQTFRVLEVVSQIKRKKLRDAVLKDLKNNKSLYKAIREVAVRIVNKNVILNKKQKSKLRKFKTTILELASERVPKTKRSRLLQQSGGFSLILIFVVSALIASIANKAR